MFNHALLKRFVPFVAAFALGLLVASFFVSITPNFENYKRKKRPHHGRHEQMLKERNEQLEIKNQRLQERLDALESQSDGTFAVPAQPLDEAPMSR